MKIHNCKTCKYWKHSQSLLNYHNDIGFCLNPKFSFNTVEGRTVGVVDLENLKPVKVSGNPSHDFESITGINVDRSRYLLQTSADFGCIFHKEENDERFN